MKVVTAIENFVPDPETEEITVFLAGGITNCWDWQKFVIEYLKEKEKEGEDLSRMVIFNPRRPNFPIDDPFAAYAQIEWEYKQLMACDIFSMYFAGGSSIQPICMYELGRYSYRMENLFPWDYQNRVIVTVEPTYKRVSDVVIQMQLAFGPYTQIVYRDNAAHVNAVTATIHADRIIRSYKKILKQYEKIKDEADV
jgi:hypothetical protein